MTNEERKALEERLRERITDNLLAGLPYNRDGDEAADCIHTDGQRIAELVAENDRLREHFAENRIQTEQKIAAWLENQGETHRSIWGVSIDPKIMRLADAIKAGEYL